MLKEFLEKYDIMEESGIWKGFKVWYVKPKPCKMGCLKNEGLPQFLLYDGDIYRYAKQPSETQEIIKDFCVLDFFSFSC